MEHSVDTIVGDASRQIGYGCALLLSIWLHSVSRTVAGLEVAWLSIMVATFIGGLVVTALRSRLGLKLVRVEPTRLR